MLEARTAIGFSLSCELSEIGPHTEFRQSHLEGIVASSSLSYCGRHLECYYSKATDKKRPKWGGGNVDGGVNTQKFCEVLGR